MSRFISNLSPLQKDCRHTLRVISLFLPFVSKRESGTGTGRVLLSGPQTWRRLQYVLERVADRWPGPRQGL